MALRKGPTGWLRGPSEPLPFQEAGAGGQTSRGFPVPPALKMTCQDSSSQHLGLPFPGPGAGSPVTALLPGPQLRRAKGRELEPQKCQRDKEVTVTEARRESNTHTHTPIPRTHTVWHRHLVRSLGNTARQILTDHKLGYEHSYTKPEEISTHTDTQFPQVRVASPLPAGAPPPQHTCTSTHTGTH